MATAGGPCFVWQEILQVKRIPDDIAKIILQLSKQNPKMNQGVCTVQGKSALAPHSTRALSMQRYH